MSRPIYQSYHIIIIYIGVWGLGFGVEATGADKFFWRLGRWEKGRLCHSGPSQMPDADVATKSRRSVPVMPVVSETFPGRSGHARCSLATSYTSPPARFSAAIRPGPRFIQRHACQVSRLCQRAWRVVSATSASGVCSNDVRSLIRLRFHGHAG